MQRPPVQPPVAPTEQPKSWFDGLPTDAQVLGYSTAAGVVGVVMWYVSDENVSGYGLATLGFVLGVGGMLGMMGSMVFIKSRRRREKAADDLAHERELDLLGRPEQGHRTQLDLKKLENDAFIRGQEIDALSRLEIAEV